jgi:hypothetical protein
MGKNTKFVAAFIDDISDSKLSGFPSQATTIAKDQDFRLDMQGVCSLAYRASLHLLMVIILGVPTNEFSVDQRKHALQSTGADQQPDPHHFAQESRTKNCCTCLGAHG